MRRPSNLFTAPSEGGITKVRGKLNPSVTIPMENTAQKKMKKAVDTGIPKKSISLDKDINKRTKFIKDYLVDFTTNSNLHGLRYIGEKERTLIEKAFWMIMFICCVVLCAVMIRQVYDKWNDSPVIVSFAESSTPVWQIPFPAVTICLEMKSMQTRYNFTKFYNLYETGIRNLTEDEIQLFEDISLVCDNHLPPKYGRKFSNPVKTFRQILAVAPKLKEVFGACQWKDNLRDCSQIFYRVVTEEGICYTFNTLGADQLLRTENIHHHYLYLEKQRSLTKWTLDSGYPIGSPIETEPHRGTGYGAKASLKFMLRARLVDLDYLCKGPIQGFKILLHNPAELPRLSLQYFRSPLSQEVIVAVKPNMMTTSKGLRSYEPERRQCYFPNERYLRYFKIYTQSNCEIECLTNFTYVRCGCAKFGVPYSPDMLLCNAGSVECMNLAEMELVTIAVLQGIDTPSGDNDSFNEALKVAEQCRCLPACTSIAYEAETSQADYNVTNTYNSFQFKSSGEEISARVVIFFKEPQFITSRRSELYGYTDFLSNCGGLLGLFLGFSILSAVEIIYFLTLRLFYMFCRKRNDISGKEQNVHIINYPSFIE